MLTGAQTAPSTNETKVKLLSNSTHHFLEYKTVLKNIFFTAERN